MLHELIECADKAVDSRVFQRDVSYEGVCYLFANSIIDYAKMAYDNICIGHFKAAHMMMRTMIENVVCLDVIIHNEKEELWKYYYVQSYRNIMKLAKDGLSVRDDECIQEMRSLYNLEDEFFDKGDKKKAYIDCQYGWTYKINQNFNFAGLCNLVYTGDYDDFKMMSDYSHGTSLYQKFSSSIGIEHIMNMISLIYVEVDRVIRMYCWDAVDDLFDEIAFRLENLVCNSLGDDVK